MKCFSNGCKAVCPRSDNKETIENEQLIVKVDYRSIIGQGAYGTVYSCTYSRQGNQTPDIHAVVKVQDKRTEGASNQRENAINALMGYEIGSLELGDQSFTVMPHLGKALPTHLKTDMSLRSHLQQRDEFVNEERLVSSLLSSEKVIVSDNTIKEPHPKSLEGLNDNAPYFEPEPGAVAEHDTHSLEVVDNTSQAYFEIEPEPDSHSLEVVDTSQAYFEIEPEPDSHSLEVVDTSQAYFEIEPEPDSHSLEAVDTSQAYFEIEPEPDSHSLEVVDTSQAYFEIEPEPEPDAYSLEVVDTSQAYFEIEADPSSLKTERTAETEIKPGYFERSSEAEATPPRFSSKTTLNTQSEAAVENMADIIGLFLKINQSVMKLHQMGIVHLDIKPANLLYDAENDKVNIIDFGHSRFLADKSPKDFIGTAAFMAPELAKKQLKGEFTEQQDIYSLGKTFLYLIQNHLIALNKDAVYQGLPDDADDYGILGRFCLKEVTQLNNIEFNNPNNNPKIQAMNDLLKVMRALLASSPTDRMALSEVDKQLTSIYLNLNQVNQNKLRLTEVEVEKYLPAITQLLQSIEASSNNAVRSKYSQTSSNQPSGGLFGLMQQARSELQSNELSSISNMLVEHIKSILRDSTLEAKEQNQMIVDLMQKTIEDNFPMADLTREALDMKSKLEKAQQQFTQAIQQPEKTANMRLKS